MWLCPQLQFHNLTIRLVRGVALSNVHLGSRSLICCHGPIAMGFLNTSNISIGPPRPCTLPCSPVTTRQRWSALLGLSYSEKQNKTKATNAAADTHASRSDSDGLFYSVNFCGSHLFSIALL